VRGGGSGARSRVRRNDDEDDETLLPFSASRDPYGDCTIRAIGCNFDDPLGSIPGSTKRLAVPGLWSNANLFRRSPTAGYRYRCRFSARVGRGFFSKGNNRIIKSILAACSFKRFSLSPATRRFCRARSPIDRSIDE